MKSFTDRLTNIQEDKQSIVCVGLDPVPERLPAELHAEKDPIKATVIFNKAIIEATSSIVSAYKINFAFFEALGVGGMEAIYQTRAAIPSDILTIADAKRGDIGHSARFYAHSVFDQLGFDSCTVSPYLGRESVEPFLNYEDKATFILARTSNPGSDAIQKFSQKGTPLFSHVANQVTTWDAEFPGTTGLVAGATYPDDLAVIQREAPGCPLLVPGIGAQGGDLGKVLDAARPNPVLITSSRSIIYADDSSTLDDAAMAAAHACRELKNRIRLLN